MFWLLALLIASTAARKREPCKAQSDWERGRLWLVRDSKINLKARMIHFMFEKATTAAFYAWKLPPEFRKLWKDRRNFGYKEPCVTALRHKEVTEGGKVKTMAELDIRMAPELVKDLKEILDDFFKTRPLFNDYHFVSYKKGDGTTKLTPPPPTQPPTPPPTQPPPPPTSTLPPSTQPPASTGPLDPSLLDDLDPEDVNPATGEKSEPGKEEEKRENQPNPGENTGDQVNAGDSKIGDECSGGPDSFDGASNNEASAQNCGDKTNGAGNGDAKNEPEKKNDGLVGDEFAGGENSFADPTNGNSGAGGSNDGNAAADGATKSATGDGAGSSDETKPDASNESEGDSSFGVNITQEAGNNAGNANADGATKSATGDGAGRSDSNNKDASSNGGAGSFDKNNTQSEPKDYQPANSAENRNENNNTSGAARTENSTNIKLLGSSGNDGPSDTKDDSIVGGEGDGGPDSFGGSNNDQSSDANGANSSGGDNGDPSSGPSNNNPGKQKVGDGNAKDSTGKQETHPASLLSGEEDVKEDNGPVGQESDGGIESFGDDKNQEETAEKSPNSGPQLGDANEGSPEHVSQKKAEPKKGGQETTEKKQNPKKGGLELGKKILGGLGATKPPKDNKFSGTVSLSKGKKDGVIGEISFGGTMTFNSREGKEPGADDDDESGSPTQGEDATGDEGAGAETFADAPKSRPTNPAKEGSSNENAGAQNPAPSGNAKDQGALGGPESFVNPSKKKSRPSRLGQANEGDEAD